MPKYARSNRYARANPRWQWQSPEQDPTDDTYFKISAEFNPHNGHHYVIHASWRHTKVGIYLTGSVEDNTFNPGGTTDYEDLFVIPFQFFEPEATPEQTFEKIRQYLEEKADNILFTPKQVLSQTLRNPALVWQWETPRYRTTTYKTYPIQELRAQLQNELDHRYIITGTIKHGLHDTLVEGLCIKYPLDLATGVSEPFVIPTQVIPTTTAPEVMAAAKRYLEEQAQELMFSPMELLSFSL